MNPDGKKNRKRELTNFEAVLLAFIMGMLIGIVKLLIDAGYVEKWGI